MAKLDFTTIFQNMIAAARTSLGNTWPAVADIADSAFKTLAQTLVDIEQMRMNKTVSEEQARLLLNMHKNTTRIILLSVEVVGLLRAEAAINAAMDAIRIPINAALGFEII